jgi:hypothetical protein
MKLHRPNRYRRTGERGFFLVAALLIIAGIMLIYIAANGGRLATLKKEIRLVEQKQIERLNRSSVVTTNSPAPIPTVTLK